MIACKEAGFDGKRRLGAVLGMEDADLCAIALKVTGGEQFWMVCSCIPPGLPCAVALGWCFVH